MTEENDVRVRELISELVDASPTAPPFFELTTRRRNPRRRRPIVATVVGVAVLGVVLGGIAIFKPDAGTKGSSARVRVDAPHVTYGPQTTYAPQFVAAPRYVDVSKPPPLRIAARGQFVDVSTMLGCWFHVPGDAAGHGVGVCADGVVDPSRFRLTVTTGRRVELLLPIDAEVSAFLADAPPPPAPHELATVVTDRRAVKLQRDGVGAWSFSFPGADHDLALFVDIHANASTNNVRVSGDANYGATLVTQT